MAIGFPLINGSYYSFADIEFRFEGFFFVGIKTIDYSDALGRSWVRGTARKPIGRTAGRYEAKGTVEFYKPAWDLLLLTLIPLGLVNGGWRRTAFTVTVSYGSIAGGLPATTDVLTGVTLNDVEASQSESEDPLTRKCTMMIQEVLWGGSPSIFEPIVTTALG